MNEPVRASLFASVLFGAALLFAAPPQGETGAPVPGPSLAPAEPQGSRLQGTVPLTEAWGYLLSGEERFLAPSLPLTDVAYFGAGMNAYGELVGVPSRARLASWGGRVHLVVAEGSNHALSHFCLDPKYGVRDTLIASIAEASRPFDGVQIDFEAIPAADSGNFIAFLTALRASLPAGKTLSVALPARTKRLADPYEYGAAAAVADRIIVMAYDEHWSGGSPGPIASLEWCERVASYAASVISPEKLVMGVPFYGRAWGDLNPSKAYRFSTLGNLMNDKAISDVYRTGEIPWFEYSETVRVKVFYEDSHSITKRARLYGGKGISRLAFWRLGQEDPEIWSSFTPSAD